MQGWSGIVVVMDHIDQRIGNRYRYKNKDKKRYIGKERDIWNSSRCIKSSRGINVGTIVIVVLGARAKGGLGEAVEVVEAVGEEEEIRGEIRIIIAMVIIVIVLIRVSKSITIVMAMRMRMAMQATRITIMAVRSIRITPTTITPKAQ